MAAVVDFQPSLSGPSSGPPNSLFRGPSGRALLAATVGCGVSLTPAVHAVFGLFLVHLSAQFGWPRASISAVLGIIAVVGALIYPLAGRYVDRHGARRTLIVGTVGMALGVAALAATNGSLVRFYATFTVIAVFASLNATPLFQKVIAEWFDSNRGIALGIGAGVGIGVGSVILPWTAALVVKAWGWRAGYLSISAIVLVVGLPVMLAFLRDRSPGTEGKADLAESDPDQPVEVPGIPVGAALRRPEFWLIVVAIAVGAGALTAIFSHIVPILEDRGYSVDEGTAVISVFALVTSAWQVATGRIMDLSPTPRIAVPMYLTAVAGLLLLELGNGMPALLCSGVLLGIGLGTQYGILPFFIARYFGVRYFGAIVGALYSAVILAQGFTPILLDAVYDAQKTYHEAVLFAAGALGVAALMLLLLPGYQTQAGPPEAP